MNASNNNIPVADKLKVLGLDESYLKKQLNEKLITTIYDNILKLNQKPKNSVHIKKPKTDKKVDKTDEKYKLILEFLNSILVKIGKEQIDDITKFQKIKREDLLKPECKLILNQYLEKLVAIFGKNKICYRMKDQIDTYILTVIRNIISESGYNFESKSTTKNNTISNRNYKQDYYLYYSIN